MKNLNNLYPERNYQDLKRLVPYAGQTFWEPNPSNAREYRTCYMRFNAFTGKVTPMFSNFVEGTPPDEMQQLAPQLLSAVMRMNTTVAAPFH